VIDLGEVDAPDEQAAIKVFDIPPERQILALGREVHPPMFASAVACKTLLGDRRLTIDGLERYR
jgi:hypothetical protein